MKKVFQSVFLVFVASMVLLMSGCAPASTFVLPAPSQTNTPRPTSMPQHPNTPESSALSEQIIREDPHTIAEVEELAGFDVKEPTYLPQGVSFEFATYQETPYRGVTLYFKFVHEQYGDMGRFFMITQEPEAGANPDPVACGVNNDACETLQIDSLPVKYRGEETETLMWQTDGFSFRLHRVAGEPNKVYKEELVKIVGSMK